MAQDDQVSAYRIRAGSLDVIRIDGRLTEDVWTRFPALTGFRQREPLEGAAATERTEIRLAYDDEALYIAVMAYDSRPNEIVARILQRDKLLQADRFGQAGVTAAGDDVVAILFDPFHDHRNGVLFATNPNGAEFEALITDEGGGLNIDWRGVADLGNVLRHAYDQVMDHRIWQIVTADLAPLKAAVETMLREVKEDSA